MKSLCLRTGVLSSIFLSAEIGLVSSAWAMASSEMDKPRTAFRVSAEIKIDGKVVSRPKIVVGEKELAAVEQRSRESLLHLGVIASNSARTEMPGAIELAMDLEYRRDKHVVTSTPHLVLEPGKEGTVTVTSESSKTMEMTVKVERL